MILDDEYIAINELIALINKNKKEKTVHELERQNELLKDLSNSTHIQVRTNHEPKKLNHEQKLFISHILPIYLLNNIPKLEDVMQVYDLRLDDTLVVTHDNDYNDYQSHWRFG